VGGTANQDSMTKSGVMYDHTQGRPNELLSIKINAKN